MGTTTRAFVRPLGPEGGRPVVPSHAQIILGLFHQSYKGVQQRRRHYEQEAFPFVVGP